MRAHDWCAPGIIAALLFFKAEPASKPPIPPFASELPTIRSGAPVFAFNGKDLSGFYTFTRYSKYDDPKHDFRVKDGMIQISGREPGGISTREVFANYHLIVEWKWGARTWYPRRFEARNSGVMVHSSGPDGDALACWMQSIECQINEGGVGDLIVVPGKSSGEPPSLSSEVRVGPDGQNFFEKGGTWKTLRRGRFNWWGRDPDWKNVLWFRGEREVENPTGEWNRMEIVCDGDAITCILNGVLVNQARKSSLTSGKILIQSEGAEILFRKVEVRPLLQSSIPRAAPSQSFDLTIKIP